MKTEQKGFTLIELIMAAALFGFVLLFAVTSFVQINRAYNKGITTKRIQQSTRQIVEELSRAISVSGVEHGSSNITINLFNNDASGCLYVANGLRYLWNEGFIDREAGEYAFVRDTETNETCEGSNPAPTVTYNVVEFLDAKVAIQNLTVEQLPGNPNAYFIEATLASNTDDLIDVGNTEKCFGGSGDQFCDTATLRTVVTVRR